jgi:hypothetical protein
VINCLFMKIAKFLIVNKFKFNFRELIVNLSIFINLIVLQDANFNKTLKQR